LPDVRFHTETSWPAFTRLAAIGCPMIPKPKKATRIAGFSDLVVETRLAASPLCSVFAASRRKKKEPRLYLSIHIDRYLN
jgi:hypothetical protein